MLGFPSESLLAGGLLTMNVPQVIDNWYPGDAKKDKGVLLVVTAGKEGAVTGGDSFVQVMLQQLIWFAQQCRQPPGLRHHICSKACCTSVVAWRTPRADVSTNWPSHFCALWLLPRVSKHRITYGHSS